MLGLEWWTDYALVRVFIIIVIIIIISMIIIIITISYVVKHR